MTALGPSMGPLSRCPFGHCMADVMLTIEQAAPGDDEATLKRVPQHQMVGEASRFGQCPASLMVIPLDAYSRETLKTQAAAIGLMVAKDAQPRVPRDPPQTGIYPVGRPRGSEAGEHPLTPHVDPKHEFQRLGYQGGPKRPSPGTNVPQHGKAGQTVVPLPDVQHAGPGPGRASKPHQPTAADIVVQHVPGQPIIDKPPAQGESRGAPMDNNMRDQLRALCLLAIEGFSQEQEQAASLTMATEQLEVQLKGLENKQQATHTLAVAAVGGGASIPASAASMVGSSSDVGGALEQIASTLLLVKDQIAAAHVRAGKAAESGREYLAVI